MTLDLEVTAPASRQAELFPEIGGAAARHFGELGHSAVHRLFGEAEAEAALDQLGQRLLRYHLLRGTQVEAVTLGQLPTASRDTAFDHIFNLINGAAHELGSAFEVDGGYQAQAQLLYARPGAHGRRHLDDRCQLTAITNLKGNSSLWVDGDLTYQLSVGDVVFIRGQELVHQGLATGSQPRTGLVIGKVPSVSLTPKTG